MIRTLLQFALNQRMGTIALAFLIVIGGIWSWISLKKVAYPDIGDTQVTVITQFPGRAAEEVEQQITIPLERALNSVPNVISRRSKTIFGLSVISLTFDDNTGDYFARQQVLEKLSDAVLPDGVSPSLGPLTGPVDEIFRYVIEAPPGYTPMDLRTLQDWVVVPKLLQAPGIADVINFGGLVKQFHVITAPDKLLRYHVSLQNLIDAITANNLNTGGNIIRRGGQGFVVRGIGAIRSREDIGNIVVTAYNGVPVFVRDLAVVEEAPLPPSGVLGYSLKGNDSIRVENGSGIQGLVAMRRGENPSDVITGLKAKVDEINENDLPEGVRLRITYDRSDLVDYTIHTVSHTLLEGILIILVVLVFFMGSVRTAFVVATTIPISMLFAFMMMKTTGIPASLLSLGAIDFGIIVDGAVVMVENIMRRYRDMSAAERQSGIIPVTLSAAEEVGREIFFSITIIILAYLPIFTFQRVEGKLFSPMAWTLGFAITGSMLLALTVIPVLMTFLFRKYFASADPGRIEWHNPLYYTLERWYRALVARLLRRSGLTVTVTAVIVLAGIAICSHAIGTEFLPELDEGAINIRCFFPVGITLDEANRYTTNIRETIGRYPAVASVITQLGRNDDGTDPYGPNRCEVLVGLRPYDTWTSSMSKTQLLRHISQDLGEAVPGAVFSFSQPILDNVTEAVTGSVADLAILISGNDLHLMRRKADSILSIIRSIPGSSESGIEQENDQAQLSVEIDRRAAARYGINVSDIEKMIEAAIGGKTISTLYDGSRRFDIVVRYSSEYRATIEAVRRLLVPGPGGASIPLSQLAAVGLVDGPTIIQREDGKRQISVRTNIHGRDQGGFVKEAREKVNAAVTLPKGYTMEWGGQFENLSRAGARMAVIIPITLGIIILLLSILFRNIRDVIVAMSCIPFAILGGLAALLLRGYHLNVSSGVGFISLFGISGLLGVLYVSRVRRLTDDEGMEYDTAVQQAARIQFRPGMMAILLALLGLIPASLASGIGSDVQRPLATVIVGGLTAKLLFTLPVLPSIHLAVHRLFHGRKIA